MTPALLLDQPDLIAPARTRRLRFGAADAPRIAILNARGARFEGGGDEPELSLKWIPQGRAQYRSEGKNFALGGGANLLLNVPPNRHGLLQAEDVHSLQALHGYLQATFSRDLALKAKREGKKLGFYDPVAETLSEVAF